MEYTRFGDTLLVRLDKGDELFGSIMDAASREHITLASISGIGATNDFTVGVFDTSKQAYDTHTFTGDFEITSITGNVTTMNGETYVHMHMTCAGGDCNIIGGHLLRCTISLTGEVFLHIGDGCVDRSKKADLGINTLDLPN